MHEDSDPSIEELQEALKGELEHESDAGRRRAWIAAALVVAIVVGGFVAMLVYALLFRR